MTFQVKIGDGPSCRFLSRPGTFSYGRFDNGARALCEVMEIEPGDRVLDLGCGCRHQRRLRRAAGRPARGTSPLWTATCGPSALAEHNATGQRGGALRPGRHAAR